MIRIRREYPDGVDAGFSRVPGPLFAKLEPRPDVGALTGMTVDATHPDLLQFVDVNGRAGAPRRCCDG